jgi:septation ring formation regulator EzrA
MSTLSMEEVEVPAVADDFSTLEERIQRVVEVVKRERAARAEAEEKAARLEKLLNAQTALQEQAQGQLRSLEREREQVRQRVERLVKQIEEIAS